MQPKSLGAQVPGPAKPFLLRTARTRVRRADKKAGLPDWLTLAACRHGGMTELGDAELTESGIIALSVHRTADAGRGMSSALTCSGRLDFSSGARGSKRPRSRASLVRSHHRTGS